MSEGATARKMNKTARSSFEGMLMIKQTARKKIEKHEL